MGKYGHNMERVHKRNIESILHLLQVNGMLSRKDLADHMGLSSASLTINVNQLIKEGILTETNEVVESANVGRKKQLVTINYGRYLFIGVTIDSHSLQVCLGTMKLDVLQKEVIYLETMDTSEIVAQIDASINRLLMKQNQSKNMIYGIGLSVIGIVDQVSRLSIKSWGIMEKNNDIASQIEQKTKIPVYIENNVRALALASLYLNYPTQLESFVFARFGNGIGSAIYLNNQFYEGHHLLAGELGHVYVDAAQDQVCRCGKTGCLETVASIWSLKKLMNKEDLTPESILEAYDAGHEIVSTYINQAIQQIAKALYNYIVLFDPEMVYLYGYLFERDDFYQRVIHTIETLTDANFDASRIKVSAYNRRLESSGALSIVMRAYVQQGGSKTILDS